MKERYLLVAVVILLGLLAIVSCIGCSPNTLELPYHKYCVGEEIIIRSTGWHGEVRCNMKRTYEDSISKRHLLISYHTNKDELELDWFSPDEITPIKQEL